LVFAIVFKKAKHNRLTGIIRPHHRTEDQNNRGFSRTGGLKLNSLDPHACNGHFE
jgi:hypothetical protein